MQKLKNHISSNIELTSILGLCIIFYFIFFHNIWAYPLMDTDETRYVSMARDMFNNREFLTLYLNGDFFFEKPPLFFWIESLSFGVLGKINEFTARFPMAILGTIISFSNYYIGKKIISRSYGVISSLILATSIEFCMLSKLAILDIVVSAFIALSLNFGLATFFCRESRKKYYWWLFYTFSAFAVMAKGIPGFVVPFGSLFFIALLSKKVKDALQPINVIPGLLIFLLITLPWHILMFKLHNPLFWNEYIIKHHLSRFLGSEAIDRSQPFYFYLTTLLWGFFPWIISCACIWAKMLFKQIQTRALPILKEDACSRFLTYNTIIVIFTLFFFSSSETKLITYILPLFPALSFLGGYIWWNYIEKQTNAKTINTTNYVIGTTLIIIAILGILASTFIPESLLLDLGSLRIFSILTAFGCGLALILFTRKKIYIGSFSSLVAFMLLFSAIGTEKIYQLDYKFGQYDLMEFAEIAEKENVSLTTFKFGTKYCLIYYGKMPVTYGPQEGITNIRSALEKKDNFVIIKNKHLNELKYKNFDIIKTGRKYSLIDLKKKGTNKCTN